MNLVIIEFTIIHIFTYSKIIDSYSVSFIFKEITLINIFVTGIGNYSLTSHKTFFPVSYIFVLFANIFSTSVLKSFMPLSVIISTTCSKDIFTYAFKLII